MKQPCEKPKMVADTSDTDMLNTGSPTLVAEKEGSSVKEAYEEPEMKTETIDVGTLFASLPGDSWNMNSYCPPDCDD